MERGRWWWRRLVFAQFESETFTTARLDSAAERLWQAEFPITYWSTLMTVYQMFQEWESEMEIGAWRYELVRRICHEREFLECLKTFRSEEEQKGRSAILLSKPELDDVIRHLLPNGHFPSWPSLPAAVLPLLGRLRETTNKGCYGSTTDPMGKGPGWSHCCPVVGRTLIG